MKCFEDRLALKDGGSLIVTSDRNVRCSPGSASGTAMKSSSPAFSSGNALTQWLQRTPTLWGWEYRALGRLAARIRWVLGGTAAVVVVLAESPQGSGAHLLRGRSSRGRTIS